MEHRIEKIDGAWVRKGEYSRWKGVVDKAFHTRGAWKRCPRRDICVQAGGNWGQWAIYLSKVFGKVYTFEPEPTNFKCLSLNVSKYPNIIPTEAALGDKEQLISFNMPGSSLSGYVVEEPGRIAMTTVDKLDLPTLDFLCLDVEGFEYPALEGAAYSILHHKPMIQLENRNLGKKKGRGHTWEDISKLLTEWGYEPVQDVGYDVIWGPKRD